MVIPFRISLNSK
jgi:hypothetical protein